MKRHTLLTSLAGLLLASTATSYATTTLDTWKDLRYAGNSTQQQTATTTTPPRYTRHTLRTKKLAAKPKERRNIQLVKHMLQDVSEKMNPKSIDRYYAKDFKLVSKNSRNVDLKTFKRLNTKTFKSLKSIKVNKPYNHIFANKDKVVAHVTMLLTDKNNKQQQVDMMIIAQIKDGKIYRLWDFNYPDWRIS